MVLHPLASKPETQNPEPPENDRGFPPQHFSGLAEGEGQNFFRKAEGFLRFRLEGFGKTAGFNVSRFVDAERMACTIRPKLLMAKRQQGFRFGFKGFWDPASEPSEVLRDSKDFRRHRWVESALQCWVLWV